MERCSQGCLASLCDILRTSPPALELGLVALRHAAPCDLCFQVLVWVEATVYQLDEDNEALSQQGVVDPGRRLLGEECLRSGTGSGAVLFSA